MNSEIGYIHHVGQVVHDLEQARKHYERLGFFSSPPTYPILARQSGEPARPFGAANTHVSFARNFVEIMAVVTEESRIPDDARAIPLQVPPAALPQVIANIERTIAKIATSLKRFEGLHILVFQTRDAQETAKRFDQIGVGHSGINIVQQSVDTPMGQQLIPMGVIEIDREDVPEGRLAVAENRHIEIAAVRSTPQHPNGALDLVEAILCTPDEAIEHYVERYQRYLGRATSKDGAAYVFDLQNAWIKLIPASKLETLLPGETAPALPAFVAYTVAVQELERTRKFLASSGIATHETGSGDIFVPSQAALGAAIIFRQIQ